MIWFKAGRRCKRCNLPLWGSYVKAMNAEWHAECWRCSRCQELIRGNFFVHEGQPICEKDYLTEVAPRCSICGCVLKGSFMHNPFGQCACPAHSQDPKCTSCQRWLLPEDRIRVGGLYGSTPCRACLAGSIDDSRLRSYHNAFGTKALRQLGLVLGAQAEVAVRLASAAQIRQLKGTEERQLEGLTETSIYTVNGKESSREVKGIVIVGGLAREHFEAVLAHEYGHVWLFLSRLDHPTELLAEGFCELVRHEWLKQLATPLALELQTRMCESKDPIYGDGFRLMEKTWREKGLRGVLGLLGR